jgi:hypothetical protein
MLSLPDQQKSFHLVTLMVAREGIAQRSCPTAPLMSFANKVIKGENVALPLLKAYKHDVRSSR